MVVADDEAAFRVAERMWKGGVRPRGLKSAMEMYVAICTGRELGLPVSTSLTCIAMRDGEPVIFGDAITGLIEADPSFAKMKVRYEPEQMGEPESMPDDYRCVIDCWRKGETEPISTSYSVAEAKQAGLWLGANKHSPKASPWYKHPNDMLFRRCAKRVQRQVFPRSSLGLMLDDEMEDLREPEYTVSDGVRALREAQAKEAEDARSRDRAAATGGPDDTLRDVSSGGDTEIRTGEVLEGRGDQSRD